MVGEAAWETPACSWRCSRRTARVCGRIAAGGFGGRPGPTGRWERREGWGGFAVRSAGCPLARGSGRPGAIRQVASPCGMHPASWLGGRTPCREGAPSRVPDPEAVFMRRRRATGASAGCLPYDEGSSRARERTRICGRARPGKVAPPRRLPRARARARARARPGKVVLPRGRTLEGARPGGCVHAKAAGYGCLGRLLALRRGIEPCPRTYSYLRPRSTRQGSTSAKVTPCTCTCTCSCTTRKGCIAARAHPRGCPTRRLCSCEGGGLRVPRPAACLTTRDRAVPENVLVSAAALDPAR